MYNIINMLATGLCLNLAILDSMEANAMQGYQQYNTFSSQNIDKIKNDINKLISNCNNVTQQVTTQFPYIYNWLPTMNSAIIAMT